MPDGVLRLDWESADQPGPGDDLWIWGFPGGEIFGPNTNATLSRGIVSAIQSLDLFDQQFSNTQTDAAINPGNSGGPVVLDDGRLIGISDFAILIGATDAEGLNFAINVPAHRDRIRELIES